VSAHQTPTGPAEAPKASAGGGKVTIGPAERLSKIASMCPDCRGPSTVNLYLRSEHCEACKVTKDFHTGQVLSRG